MKGLLVALSLSTAASPAIADTIVLKADEWCPANCDPKAKDPGFFVEAAQEAFRAAGHTVEYGLMPWAKAIETARSGGITGIIGASAGDAKDFIFPETPLAVSEVCVFVTKDSPLKYESTKSFEGITLGAVKGASYGDNFDAYITQNPKKVDLVGGDDAKPTLLRLLQGNKIGAVVEVRMIWEYFTKKNGVAEKIRVAGCEKGDGIFIAFSPANPKSKEYAKILNDYTVKALKSGKLKSLKAKYGLSE